MRAALRVHTRVHLLSHFVGSVNKQTKKSNLSKKSELSIKTCSENVALEQTKLLQPENELSQMVPKLAAMQQMAVSRRWWEELQDQSECQVLIVSLAVSWLTLRPPPPSLHEN